MISSEHDNELVSGFKKGEINAVRQVYEKYYRLICYYAESLIRHKQEAEDIAVESFVKLLQRKEEFSSLPQIKTFLYTVSRNACIDYYRREKRHHFSHNELRYISLESENDEDPFIISSEVLQAMYEEIEKLPPKCGHVFKLFFFKSFTTEQVAHALQISPKTVLNQKAKAVRLLRIALLRREILLLIIISMMQKR